MFNAITRPNFIQETTPEIDVQSNTSSRKSIHVIQKKKHTRDNKMLRI